MLYNVVQAASRSCIPFARYRPKYTITVIHGTEKKGIV